VKHTESILSILAAGVVLVSGSCAQGSPISEAIATSLPAEQIQALPAPQETSILPSPDATTPGLPPTTPPPGIMVSTTFDPHAPATEFSLTKLQAEFAADPMATVSRYAGHRFIFRGVSAEKVSYIYKPMDGDQFVINGSAKFRPLFASYLTPLKVNSVMDIEGTVDYLQWGYLVVSGCVYTVTDTSNALDRPDYIFTF
jgi:hypothetical protein